ncbi:MAG: hypothetical protein DCF32_07185 [Leptolyngbya sp.]|nr:MAG: hypothetical protein DCF32_07185 [Leptolyngbya sp.]
MNATHYRILQSIAEAEKEIPSLRGRIPVETMLMSKLSNSFVHQGQLGQAIKYLDQEGLVKIEGRNALGHVSITDLGRARIEES